MSLETSFRSASTHVLMFLELFTSAKNREVILLGNQPLFGKAKYVICLSKPLYGKTKLVMSLLYKILQVDIIG